MPLTDLIVPEAILVKPPAASKRQALQGLAEALAGAAGLDVAAVLDPVLLRERLAGTGVGEGVAIPHARLPGLAEPIAGLARLEVPLDFDALDRQPVDLVVMLLTPAERGADHLKALARVARALRRADLRERIRAARTREDVLAALADERHSDAA